MGKVFCYIVLSLLLVGLLLFLYGKALYLNAESATIACVRSEGQLIVRRAKELYQAEPVISNKHKGQKLYATSTDFMNDLIFSNKYSDGDRLLQFSFRHMKISGPNPRLNSSNNIWTVVNNLPTNAPECFIVLATRNLDPRSFRIRLTNEQMKERLQILADDDCLLKRFAIAIRKDGSAYIWNRSISSGRCPTYRDLYNFQPFDMTTNTVDWRLVRYLTPCREVMPLGD